jgi:C4-dicarboxylate-specific signal transduction histidine kinase
MLAADGRSVWLHDVVHVVKEHGTPRELRGFLIDVTARRQAEDESRSLRDQLARVGRVTMMGELAASIAHEVNQPLCAIVSNAQAVQRLLSGENLDLDEVRSAMQDVMQDGQRASAVIARIRGFLQQAPAERTQLDINELIREVAALMQAETSRKGVAVTLELADGLPGVLGDRVQLQQVILNLVANGADARNAAANQPPELVLRSTADEAGMVTVAVIDNGVGLDPANMDRVFEAFVTTKPGRLGMGLAICKSIITAHRGRIWASRNTGPGSTFEFTLPRLGEGTA